MSKDTQQEIATPEDCKKYSKYLFSLYGGLYAIIVAFTVMCLLFTHKFSPSEKKLMYYSATVLAFALLTAITTMVAFRRRFFVVMGAFYFLLTVICADLMFYFFKTGNKYSAFLALATCIILGVIISLIIFAKLNKKETKYVYFSTKYLTYTASFVALSIVCKLISNTISTVLPVPTLKLSIVYIPWTLSGIVLGPVGGMISALLGDVIGQVIVPTGGSVLPLTVLSNTLFPLFPALMYRYSPIKKDSINVIIGLVISTLVCTLGVGTYSLYIAYYKDTKFFVYLVTRFWQLPILALNAALILGILPVMKRMGITKLFLKNKNAKA